jgi:hypothetical protein
MCVAAAAALLFLVFILADYFSGAPKAMREMRKRNKRGRAEYKKSRR